MIENNTFGDIAPDIISDAISWRHHLHRHPELAYRENLTADFIAARLSEFGLSVHRGLGGTGVVGTLARGTSRRTIAIRADMDALEVTEQSGVPHSSCTPGIMHACGHDGHVAIALAAARASTSLRELDGTVHFIFQPAEEGKAGARQMIEDGLFRLFPCDAVYALHNWPDLPIGALAAHAGPIMAGSDRFDIVLKGRGGHAAMPHHTSDVLLAASALVGQLNTVVGRRIAPVEAAVLSITQINGGHSHNVLPDQVTVSGTVRTFKTEVQEAIESALSQVAEGVAIASGTQAEVVYHRNYPPTINHPEAAAFVRSIAGSPALNFNVMELPPSMGAEDFSFMLKEVPGCYFWLGAGRLFDHANLHSPNYDFNDDAVGLGVALWTSLIRTSLSGQPL